MDERALFTKFWVDESATTSKVLGRIPEGSDYKPDPRSRTAQDIAWQIVCEEQMLIEAMERDHQRMSRGQELIELSSTLAEGINGEEGVQSRIAELLKQAHQLQSIDAPSRALVSPPNSPNSARTRCR